MKRYIGIQPNELERLKQELRNHGVIVPDGDDVELAGPHGIRLRATYERARHTLTITIVHKPFFVPKGKIWEIVDEAVDGFAD